MTKTLKSINPDVHFRVLHLLEKEPELTQRELAQKLGISLGGVNYCLKALIKIGHIKAGNFTKNSNKSAYLYFLTPRGIAEKVKLTAGFLKRKMSEYEVLKKEIDAIQLKAYSTPRIYKAKKVVGNRLVFRNATTSDADFIFNLRTDDQKSLYLSPILKSLEKQKEWLNDYENVQDQAYFIIESLSGELLGTLRLYDPKETSFCWGSWILIHGAPYSASIESALMVYSYALDHLGFLCAHFNVRKGNERVWQFHERFGAHRVSESEIDYFYKINTEKIHAAFTKYKKYLPEKVIVIGVNSNES
jgi:EPS-associated MarR family transcriptional regulator